MNGILSTLPHTGTAVLIYSSLGAHSRFRDRELPGIWFVEALKPYQHSPAAVRQALYRLEQKGELKTRKAGKQKFYRLSTYGQAAVDTTYRKMTNPGTAAWDGLWSIVVLHFPVSDRLHRDQMKYLLNFEGFASVSRGVYIHPQDRTNEIHEAAVKLKKSDCVFCYRGKRISSESDEALVKRLWDIEGMNKKYKHFLNMFFPLLQQDKKNRTNEEAFALRLALANRYSEISWEDPELPDELLPENWKGTKARLLTNELYPILLPGTLAHGKDLLNRCNVKN